MPFIALHDFYPPNSKVKIKAGSTVDDAMIPTLPGRVGYYVKFEPATPPAVPATPAPAAPKT